MFCHDLEVMSLNPSRVELGVHSTSVLSRTKCLANFSSHAAFTSSRVMGTW